MPQVRVHRKVYEQLENHSNFPFEEDAVKWVTDHAYIEVPQKTLNRLIAINPDTELALCILLEIKRH